MLTEESTAQNQEQQKKEKSFKGRFRRKKLKYIAILPSLITLLNCVFGFASITIASNGFEGGVAKFRVHDLEFTNFGVGGFMIFMAMIMDMLDGRVARISQTTSSFGGQLDSLSDIVSFGLAPAFLMWQLLSYEFQNAIEPSSFFAGLVNRFAWFSAAIYLACCAIRLARFNVENEEDEAAHMTFIGIPSPAAAGVIASLIVFQQRLFLNPGYETLIYKIFTAALTYSLPLIAVGVGLLMVSRVKYPHLLNLLFKGQKPLVTLLWCVGILAMIFISLSIALVVSFCGFALYSLIGSIRNRKGSKLESRLSKLQRQAPDDTEDI